MTTSAPPAHALTKSELVELATRHGMADTNCAHTVSNALLFARAFVDRKDQVVQVLPDQRMVKFVNNRMPCDGPMTTVTVVLREDGSLEKIDKNVLWPGLPRHIRKDEAYRQQSPAGDVLKAAPEE